jgi:FxLD family lantipeptide
MRIITEQAAASGADTTAPLPGAVDHQEDPFELDITFIEHGPNANDVIAMTDDGCETTCPNACTTSAI